MARCEIRIKVAKKYDSLVHRVTARRITTGRDVQEFSIQTLHALTCFDGVFAVDANTFIVTLPFPLPWPLPWPLRFLLRLI